MNGGEHMKLKLRTDKKVSDVLEEDGFHGKGKEDQAQLSLVRGVVESAPLVYEIPVKPGKKGENSHWMPFLLDERSMKTVKALCVAYSFVDDQDEQPLAMVRKKRPPYSPDLRVGFGKMDKLWVNLLTVEGWDLATCLWEREADMPTKFEDWYERHLQDLSHVS